jgi:anti-sigma B factor antagonist
MYEPQSPETPGPGGNLEPTLRSDVAAENGAVVVALRGELDLAAAPELLRQLQAKLAEPVSALTLDLEGLEFIDSSGLGVLCQVQEDADARGIPLELVRVPHHARRVLEVTGLTEMFTLS